MSNKSIRILVTNDDGVHSRGIHVLAEALRQVGEVCVVAPEKEQNATGHSLTLHKPLRINKISDMFYSVSGTPTDSVALAVNEIFKNPTLVVSGINKGGNLADDVTYSGTVSAAMEGVLLGIPSIAVSQVGEPEYKFETAAAFVIKLVRQVIERGLPKYTLLNVNVPNVSENDIKGIKFTSLGKRVYTKDMVIKKTDPRGRAYYWIGGNKIVWEKIEKSDYEAVSSNMISVTPLQMDMTDISTLKKISSWSSDLLIN